MTNTVRIDIDVVQRAAQVENAGKRVSESYRRAGADIDRVFDKTQRQVASSLDRIEQEAWKSGRGMDDAFGTALGGLRRSLGLIQEEAAETGASLHSSLGKSLGEVRDGAEQLARALKPATVEIDRAFDKTTRAIGNDLDKIERAAWEAGRGTDKAFQTALTHVRADFERLRAEGRRTGASLESDVGQAMRKVRAEASKLSDEVSGASKGLSETITDALGQLGGQFGGAGASMFGDLGGLLKGGAGAAAGGAIAAGALIGDFIWDGIQMEWKEDQVGALLAAQTGAAAGQAEKLGNVAGDVFSDNFGDSIDQVGEAMAAVFTNHLIDTSAPEDAIKRVTEKVMTLATTTGESADDLSRSVDQWVTTGLAGNISAAMDQVQTAQEKGLNAAHDLLDTMEEYGTKFRDLGLNGQESFGLIEQAMEGGARNTDIAADSLKEFDLRAQDASATTRRGFTAIGLDADRMGQMVAKGGGSARQALRETLNALQAMPPGIERSTAAVDLFGTKAEDLGDALYHMDLDNAAETFGDFGGSVEKAAQKISQGQTGLEKFNKTVDRLKGALGELFDTSSTSDSFWDLNVFGDAFSDTEKQLNELDVAKEKFLSTGDTTFLDQLKEKYPEASDAIDAFIKAHQGEVDATNQAKDATQGYVETLDSLIAKKQEMAGVVLDLADADMKYQESIDDADKALQDNGVTLDTTTEKGRNNRRALDDLAESALGMAKSMSDSGKSVEEVSGFLDGAGRQLVDTAQKMGMSKEEAVAYAISLGLIPNNVSTYMQLLGYDYAAARAIQFKNYIDSIPNNKVVNLRVSAQGGGHYLAGMAHGGITGAGSPWAAESGGQRHSSTMVDEAGPEVIDLPNGSRVATAGATRALAEMGAFGGGGATQVAVSLVADPAADAKAAGWLHSLIRKGALRLKVDSSNNVVVR